MEAWTDERLDDLAASLRPLPAEMARLSERMGAEVSGLSQRMEAEAGRLSARMAGLSQQIESNTEELRLVRHDLSALHRLMAQIGWGLGFAALAGLIGLATSAL